MGEERTDSTTSLEVRTRSGADAVVADAFAGLVEARARIWALEEALRPFASAGGSYAVQTMDEDAILTLDNPRVGRTKGVRVRDFLRAALTLPSDGERARTRRAAGPGRRGGAYVASAGRHAPMWRDLRDRRVLPVTSTWVDGEGPGAPLAERLARSLDEVPGADAFVLHHEGDAPADGSCVLLGATMAASMATGPASVAAAFEVARVLSPTDADGGLVELGVALCCGVPVFASGLEGLRGGGFAPGRPDGVRRFPGLDEAVAAAASHVVAERAREGAR